MHIDIAISYTSDKGDFCITICHFLLSQAVLYSDHSGMTFLVVKASSSLIAHVKGLAVFGVQYKDPGVSFCHGKFRVKEWISHGKNAKYRWNSTIATGLFSNSSLRLMSFCFSQRVLLMISFLWVFLSNMRVGKSLMHEAMLYLKVSKDHHKISDFL